MKTYFKMVHGFAIWSIILLIGWVAFLIMATPSMAGVVTSASDSGPGTLRQAIIDANADGVSTLITFDPEVFPRNIVLKTRLPANKGKGDIIDTEGKEVVIDGSELSDSEAENATCIQVMAKDVVVRGLTIQNFAANGIYVGPSETDTGVGITNVTIRDNKLINNMAGIRVSGSCGPDNRVEATIVGNDLIKNLSDGIAVAGSSSDCPGHNEVQVNIKGNRGENSSGSSEFDGHSIRVLGGFGNGSNNKIFADILNNQTSHDKNAGIVVAGAGLGPASNNYIVTKIINNITQNNGAEDSIGGNGILVRGGSYGVDPAGCDNTILFEVRGNNCTGHKVNGITLTAGTLGSNNYMHGTAVYNLAKANGRNGIHISGSAGTGTHLGHIKVKHNRLFENFQDGIHVNGGNGSSVFIEKISLVKNQAHRNGRYGIMLTRGSGEDTIVSVDGIIGNRTVLNARDGVAVENGVLGDGNTPFTFNRSLLNGEDGIDINSTEFILTRNRALNNAVDGISATGNIDGGGNVAIGNASCNTPGCF